MREVAECGTLASKVEHGGHMDGGGGEERVHAGSDVAIDAEGDDGDEG